MSDSARHFRGAVCLGAVIVATKMALSLPQLQTDVALVAITWLVVTSFVVIGLALLVTPDIPNVNGWACLLVAAGTIPGELNNPYYSGVVALTGFVLEAAYLPATVALVIRYPARRLKKSGRVIAWGLVITSMVMRIPLVFSAGLLPSPLHVDRPLAQWRLQEWWHDWAFLRAGYTGTILLLGWAGAVLVLRALRSRGVAHQSLAPLATVGAICAVSAAVDHLVWVLGTPSASFASVALIRNISAAAIPVALLADLLRRRGAAAAVSSEVLQAANSGDIVALQSSLRHVLLDPSLTVAQPSAETRLTGRRNRVEIGSDSRRLVTLKASAGNAPLVEVRYDPAAVTDAALLRTALSAASVGLDHARLAAELRVRLRELEASKARLVEAGMAERRRVERDLHDGAQQQFLALAATLAQTELVPDDQVRAVVGDARARLQDALAELRQLARGIHPALLTQGGLNAALPHLCQQNQEQVRLHLDESLLMHPIAPTIETATYFITAEALTNIARHAQARHVRVTVHAHDGRVSLDVEDDGNGQARVVPGGGLAGIQDRVEALGGELTLLCTPRSEGIPFGGTRLHVALPLVPGKL